MLMTIGIHVNVNEIYMIIDGIVKGRVKESLSNFFPTDGFPYLERTKFEDLPFQLNAAVCNNRSFFLLINAQGLQIAGVFGRNTPALPMLGTGVGIPEIELTGSVSSPKRIEEWLPHIKLMEITFPDSIGYLEWFLSLPIDEGYDLVEAVDLSLNARPGRLTMDSFIVRYQNMDSTAVERM